MGALVVGGLVRAGFTAASDFPLNDGGLFYVMVRDLQANHFALPSTISYNAAALPYAYPPLGFYLAGLLATVGPWSLLDLFRWLPLLFSVLTIPAFGSLARVILPSSRDAALATCAFALLPMGFQWLLMGGGLTRGLGFLFAILTLREVYLLYTRPSRRAVLLATLLAAATALSHPAMAWFLAYSSGLLFLSHGRTRHALRSALAVAAGTVALAAPWWLTVAARHGPAPLLASGGSGWGPFAPLQLLTLSITNEPFFPVLGALAALGALACLRERRAWLPAWAGVMALVDARSPLASASVPLALLAGVGVGGVVLPWLTDGARASPPAPTANEETALHPVKTRLPRLAVAVGSFSLFLALLNATVDRHGVLAGLSPEQRAGLDWAASATTAESRYAVVTGNTFPTRDRLGEWFPALSARASVTVIQGYEWAPDGEFGRRVERNEALQRCAQRGTDCVEDWARERGVSFDHVYLAKGATGASMEPVMVEDCCWALRSALRGDPRFELAYDGPGATVYRRLAR